MEFPHNEPPQIEVEILGSICLSKGEGFLARVGHFYGMLDLHGGSPFKTFSSFLIQPCTGLQVRAKSTTDETAFLRAAADGA